MRLYFLRHGVAGERNSIVYPDDQLRPLTRRGEKKLEGVGRYLLRKEIKLDYIFSSPYLRALQTATIVRKQMGLDKQRLVLTDQLTPQGDFEKVIEELQQVAPCDSIMLVGHEPELGELISWLLCGDRRSLVDLKKGSLCCLSVDVLAAGKCAILEWLLTPAQLLIMRG